MTPAEQIEQVFHEALTVPQGPGRAQWLARRCAGDAALFREVSALLDAQSRMEGWQDDPKEAPEEAPPLPAGPFGVYRPVRLLGHGGMSTVYLAERTDGQFEQTVALKVMAGYLSGPDFLSRFRAEGRVLASLHHPNITNLLDGGMSPAGEPFLVLEYVEGEPVDRYCDARNLDIDTRLRIFREICEAVDYAHRNLILHRDLKPANILVTADGTPKLLDFGTASLMHDGPDVTVTRARMLTPRYASPEQLRGDRPGVTGDVFSLGVILYELLTGAWPFGTSSSVLSDLKRAAGDAVAVLPASAVTDAAAAGRSQSPKRLRALLSGDLSAIVMKALENDRNRRYGTVRALIDDVERFVDGRPVQARPQTVAYRAGKFLWRHWLPIAAATVFAVGLGVAAAVALQQARSARAEAMRSQQVSQFLTGILSAANKLNFDPQKYTVAEMLDAAEQRLATGPRQDSLIEALEHLSLASSYMSMRLQHKAIAHVDRAIPTLEKAGDREDLVNALQTKAAIETDQGHLDAGVRLLERALVLLQQMGRSAPSFLVFQAKTGLAHTLSFMMQTQHDRSRQLYREAIALARNDASVPRTQFAICLANYGDLLWQEQRLPEAEAVLLESLATRTEEPDGGWKFSPLFTLSGLRAAQGDNQGAKVYAAQLVDNATRSLGPDSTQAAQSKMTWALLAAKTGETDKAAQAVAEAMPIIEKSFISPSLDLWFGNRNASIVMHLAGRYGDAETYARQSLKVILEAHLNPADPRIGNSWQAVGTALCAEHKYVEGIDALTQAVNNYHSAGPNWDKAAAVVTAQIAEARARK